MMIDLRDLAKNQRPSTIRWTDISLFIRWDVEYTHFVIQSLNLYSLFFWLCLLVTFLSLSLGFWLPLCP